MIIQTAHFTGASPERLYKAFLSAEQHAAMTADGRQFVEFQRGGSTVSGLPQVGDELLAFGRHRADGTVEYRLRATLLELSQNHRIVMAWQNAAWDAAVEPKRGQGHHPSLVVLEFAANVSGSEIRLNQVGVPKYAVRIPDTGEEGPLEDIVNTHWSLLYWEPMRRFMRAAVPL
jgi:uncharacterized protein YndB with AHSA1/START domain